MRRGLTFRGMVAAFLTAIVLLLPLGAMVASWKVPPPRPPLPPIAVLKRMTKLVTTEAHLSTFIEGGNAHWHTKYLVHGEIHLGIDMSLVQYADVDPVKRQAILRLPLPQLIMSKVDHDRSEEMIMKAKVLFACDPQVVRAEVWRAADKKIARLGQEPDHIKEAKEHAAVGLQNIFRGVDWTVRVEWEDVKGKARDCPPSRDREIVGDRPGCPAGNAAVEMAAERPRPLASP